MVKLEGARPGASSSCLLLSNTLVGITHWGVNQQKKYHTEDFGDHQAKSPMRPLLNFPWDRGKMPQEYSPLIVNTHSVDYFNEFIRQVPYNSLQN